MRRGHRASGTEGIHAERRRTDPYDPLPTRRRSRDLLSFGRGAHCHSKLMPSPTSDGGSYLRLRRRSPFIQTSFPAPPIRRSFPVPPSIVSRPWPPFHAVAARAREDDVVAAASADAILPSLAEDDVSPLVPTSLSERSVPMIALSGGW